MADEMEEKTWTNVSTRSEPLSPLDFEQMCALMQQYKPPPTMVWVRPGTLERLSPGEGAGPLLLGIRVQETQFLPDDIDAVVQEADGTLKIFSASAPEEEPDEPEG